MLKKFIITNLLMTSLLSITGCATVYSSYVVKANTVPSSAPRHAPIPAKNVHLYENNAESPHHFQVLGYISIENRYSYGIGAYTGMQHSVNDINQTLLDEAASLGANAVIHINRSRDTTSAMAVLM